MCVVLNLVRLVIATKHERMKNFENGRDSDIKMKMIQQDNYGYFDTLLEPHHTSIGHRKRSDLPVPRAQRAKEAMILNLVRVSDSVRPASRGCRRRSKSRVREHLNRNKGPINKKKAIKIPSKK